jgi:hypothetical protein
VINALGTVSFTTNNGRNPCWATTRRRLPQGYGTTRCIYTHGCCGGGRTYSRAAGWWWAGFGMAWRCLYKRRTRTPAPPAVLLQYELPRKLLGCYFLHVEFFFLVVPGPMSCSVLLACRSCRRCKRSKYSFFFLTKFFFTFRNTEVEPTYVAVNSRTTCSVSMSLGGSLEWFH